MLSIDFRRFDGDESCRLVIQRFDGCDVYNEGTIGEMTMALNLFKEYNSYIYTQKYKHVYQM